MGCIIEFDNNLRFNFAQNKGKQKIWIEVLLKFSKINIEHLADILELPPEVLVKVHQGSHYLEKESAERLGQLLLIILSD